MRRRIPRKAEMGECPACGGKIIYSKTTCSNRISIPQCGQCNKTLDQSYRPSWVFVHVQTQRRKQPFSECKMLLRDSQLSPVKFIRTRYWKVYAISDVADVNYNSASDTYDVVVGNDVQISDQNIGQVIDWLTSLLN